MAALVAESARAPRLAGESATSYEIDVDTAITLWGSYAGVGHFKGKISVRLGGQVEAAITEAHEASVGAEASTLNLKKASCCSIM